MRNISLLWETWCSQKKRFLHILARLHGLVVIPLHTFCLQLTCSVPRFLISQLNTFSIHLSYIISVSVLGFSLLKALQPKNESFRPSNIDLFFTSVSSVTVSSMSTVEMEDFSNSQLVVMTMLMLCGAEVFTSMLGLLLVKFELSSVDNRVEQPSLSTRPFVPKNVDDGTEMASVTSLLAIQLAKFELHKLANKVDVTSGNLELGLVTVANLENGESSPLEKNEMGYMTGENYDFKCNALRYLYYVVLSYLLVALFVGSLLVMMYLSLVPGASDILKKKGLHPLLFYVFTVLATFVNCGFVPTNESMIVFKNYPGLLLLLIPPSLLGSTLYPSCLRSFVWLLWKSTRRHEFEYMLKNTREPGFSSHLLTSLHSVLLVFTVVGLILVQFILFCFMEWNSGALDGMTWYQKLVGSLFQVVNTRHTGESVVDLSSIFPAILVLFSLMMYLPPHTCFLPTKYDKDNERSCEKNKEQEGNLLENLLLSTLSYLVIFVILICITEREKIKDDPLNFSPFDIIFEVLSAYRNVGFTTGYSCQRQIIPDSHCKDTWYGLSGRFSDGGKLVIILVMFFGRLEKFQKSGGKAWKFL